MGTPDFDGPIELLMVIHVTDGNGLDGTTTISLGTGRFVNVEDQRKALRKIVKVIPDPLRLMCKREWWDTLFPPEMELDSNGEAHEVRAAMIGPPEFDY